MQRSAAACRCHVPAPLPAFAPTPPTPPLPPPLAAPRPQKSIALPDVHSGYGFAIGNVAAFDMADPQAVVSPGGVGFDIK